MDNSRTKKEGVSRTYKSMDGYSLIFTYIGKEGYMLNCELRPGETALSEECSRISGEGTEDHQGIGSE